MDAQQNVIHKHEADARILHANTVALPIELLQ